MPASSGSWSNRVGASGSGRLRPPTSAEAAADPLAPALAQVEPGQGRALVAAGRGLQRRRRRPGLGVRGARAFRHPGQGLLDGSPEPAAPRRPAMRRPILLSLPRPPRLRFIPRLASADAGRSRSPAARRPARSVAQPVLQVVRPVAGDQLAVVDLDREARRARPRPGRCSRARSRRPCRAGGGLRATALGEEAVEVRGRDPLAARGRASSIAFGSTLRDVAPALERRSGDDRRPQPQLAARPPRLGVVEVASPRRCPTC